MINFIRRLFIKDYSNIESEKVREKHGLVASFFGVFTNLFLFLFKLIIGIIAHSLSIISDAINNLTDLFSCFINLFGFKMAGKKADAKHPYGHERIEYIAGMIVSFIIITVAIVLGYSSITSLISGASQSGYSIYAFIILGVSIVVKIILGIFYRGMGKAINSVSLKASMQDSLNDAISTFGVLIAAIIQYFLPEFWWIDGTMSLIISLFILYSGISLVLETAQPLIGVSPDSEVVQKVLSIIDKYKGVLGVHDIVCHSYGPTKIFMTLHCEVDGYVDMFESHDMIDEIENEVAKKTGIQLTVHMDPIDTKNKNLPKIKKYIDKILKNIDENLKFHDVRMVVGPTHTNVVFDIVVPYNLKISEEELIKIMRKEIKKYDDKYRVVIKIDYYYANIKGDK